MTLSDRFVEQPAIGMAHKLPASLADRRAALDHRMGEHIASARQAPHHLIAAIGHAVLAPGKRMRPVILGLVCGTAPVTPRAVLDAGCAVEMVHAASLILDDLPCMDNASLRRKRATTHIAYGEATAILSAIALLNQAYAVLAELEGVPETTRLELTRILARAVGWEGLVAGQELDINGQDDLSELAQVERLNWLKTGVLFVAAVEMGAVLAQCSESQRVALRRFATHLGQAFQMADDLLDKTASSAETGKDAGQDGKKTTVVKLLGIDGARAGMRGLLDRADAELAGSGIDPAPVRALIAEFLEKIEQGTRVAP